MKKITNSKQNENLNDSQPIIVRKRYNKFKFREVCILAEGGKSENNVLQTFHEVCMNYIDNNSDLKLKYRNEQFCYDNVMDILINNSPRIIYNYLANYIETNYVTVVKFYKEDIARDIEDYVKRYVKDNTLHLDKFTWYRLAQVADNIMQYFLQNI